MNAEGQASSSLGTQIVDIHESFPVGEERGEPEAISRLKNKSEKPVQRPLRLKEPKRFKNLSRQVSLETGFSVLNKDSKKDEKKALRSEKSFAAFNYTRNGGAYADERRRKEFNMFRTKSTIGKQNTMFPIRQKSELDVQRPEAGSRQENSPNKNVPAGRYFAALRGPELDQVKDTESILLPKDETWPFLLRFPINCFGICLGLSSQSILWLSLATSPATKFLHIPHVVNLCLWFLALAALITIFITYVCKCAFYFEAVKREYFHPVRSNFFFAPWVICMFLVIGAPPVLAPNKPHPAVWCVLMAPIFMLELKIYGQWLSGGKRRLCKVANPSSHLSVVGNFVGAILAAKAGWVEPAKFFWAVGFAHYLVVFVTLYQRLPTSEVLPKELHPVYSMFIAAPSAASIAWATIYGEFDGCSRTCYFIALFLYISLIVRLNFFWGFRFSVAWWSYSFPMTTASLATIKYAEQVPCNFSKGLALALSFMSSTVVLVLFVFTLLHAFVWKTLFPNDLAIAITKSKQEKEKKPARKGFFRHAPLSLVSAVTPTSTDENGIQIERKDS